MCTTTASHNGVHPANVATARPMGARGTVRLQEGFTTTPTAVEHGRPQYAAESRRGGMNPQRDNSHGGANPQYEGGHSNQMAHQNGAVIKAGNRIRNRRCTSRVPRRSLRRTSRGPAPPAARNSTARRRTKGTTTAGNEIFPLTNATGRGETVGLVFSGQWTGNRRQGPGSADSG